MSWLQKLKTEDWVVVAVSAVLLIIAYTIPTLIPGIPKGLTALKDYQAAGILFCIVAASFVFGWILLGRSLKGWLPSLIVVFAISMLAQLTASIPIVKEYGFEAVFFSVIYGLIIRNFLHIPEWMKPAIQGEFFIKIGVVCLGATILIGDVLKLGAVGLMQAIFVVGIVWFCAYLIARRFKVDRRSAMVMSSGLTICGVSACIAASRVAKADDKKLSYIVSLVLIIVVPMIYLMPWLANKIVPLLFSDPQTIAEVSGAWIGGTIDTTSGVVASSSMLGDAANQQAVIIKAVQNILIGVVAFFIALYLSIKGDGETSIKDEKPTPKIIWEKFPKFIIGFVVASLVFSLLKEGDLLTLNEKGKLIETSLAKTFSTLFFGIAFTCIGLDTRLKDIINKENRNIMWAFITAQGINIVVTLLIACLMFGIIKPLIMG